MFSSLRINNFFHFFFSKQFDYIFTLVLLLLQEYNVYHYVLIKSLRNVVNHVELRRPQTDKVICRNCFHLCSASNYSNRHAICIKLETATSEMPP